MLDGLDCRLLYTRLLHRMALGNLHFRGIDSFITRLVRTSGWNLILA